MISMLFQIDTALSKFIDPGVRDLHSNTMKCQAQQDHLGVFDLPLLSLADEEEDG